jgi:hypothetical protein
MPAASSNHQCWLATKPTASNNGIMCASGWLMSPASTKTLMLTVAGPAPLHNTVLAGANYARQYANLLVPGQIVSSLVHIV